MPPVDLTAGGQTARLREAAATISAERDLLREQVADLPGLYDELAAREEKIARLESRGIEDLRAANEVMQSALERIVASGGRGGLKVASEALDFVAS